VNTSGYVHKQWLLIIIGTVNYIIIMDNKLLSQLSIHVVIQEDIMSSFSEETKEKKKVDSP
jgi:hypothetical protein